MHTGTSTLARQGLLLLCCILCFRPALADTVIAEFDAHSLQYSLSETSAGFQITIQPVAGLSTLPFQGVLEVFPLADPSRLVIDIPTTGRLPFKKLDLLHNRLLALRFGKHPGKTRMVLDTRSNSVPRFRLRKTPGLELITVEFWLSEETSEGDYGITTALQEPEQMKFAGRSQTLTASRTPSPVVKTATLYKKRDPEPRPWPVWQKKTTKESIPQQKKLAHKSEVQQTRRLEPVSRWSRQFKKDERALLTKTRCTGYTTKLVAGGTVIILNRQGLPKKSKKRSENLDFSVLEEILYKHNPGGEPTLVARVDGLGNYSLQKIDSSEYLLHLQRVRMEDVSAFRPECAPEGFEDFHVFVAKEKKTGTDLRIYVEEGSRLFAERIREGVELKVLPKSSVRR